MKLTLILTKKYFLLLIIAVAGIIVLESCKKDIESANLEEFASAKGGGGGGGGAVTRNPLKIPSTVALATNSLYTITADVGTHKFTEGSTPATVWQYNGSFPGPTLVANTGTTMKINFKNNLNEESIIHWHGMLVDHRNDGGPMMAIPSKAEHLYEFPVLNRAALNWYHPHPHMATGKQVYNGLAGAFIIRDAEENGKGLPSGIYEVPLVFRDITLDKKGNPVYNPTGGGYLGKVPLVNGTKDPYLAVEKAVYRFRVLIGSTSRLFRLALSDGKSFHLIGNDGGLLPSSSLQPSIEVSPGERLDLLVDFRSYGSGSKIMLKEMNSGWNLLEFQVVGEDVVNNYNFDITTTSAFTSLPNIPVTRTISFDGMGQMNGQRYNMDVIAFAIPFNTVEKWRFTTNGNGPHPVHIHGASFQVVDRFGGRGMVYPHERGWKDVVLLNDAETVDVLIKFDASNYYSNPNDPTDMKGVYVIHCHKLEHEDNGMMMNFKVVGP